MRYDVITLPGDGIGTEIMPLAQELIKAVEPEVELHDRLFGGASIDANGEPLTDEVLEDCRRASGILLVAVGGPKWDTTDPSKPRPEQGLLDLRKGLGLYANLRPIRPLPALYKASPLREERIRGTDLLIIRELTGGIYFGEKTRTQDEASDTCTYTLSEIQRIARVAFGAATEKVTSVDKANVLETSRLWRKVVKDVHDREFPGVELENMLVDNAAMQLVAAPRHFDVLLTENMFGDILSDEAAMITGSIGLLPSASLGNGNLGLFEPVHGSAPDIAGQGKANPLATFYATAMLLDHLGLKEGGTAISTAVDAAIFNGLRTYDLGGTATTKEADAAVRRELELIIG